ncbi:MAG TPA: anti-sigma factor [Nevskiaceae bacterium]|nr:anti-sigma factor [Nevskiaceae bacterium]
MESPALQRLLAAEFVLGTLRGAARRRFERELARSPALRAEVRFWETRFAEMALRQISPVAPRELVWTALDLATQRPAAALPVTRPAGLLFWRSWAVAASVAALALGLAWDAERRKPPVQLPPEIVRVEVPVPQPVPVAYVALLQAPQSGAQWTISVLPGQKLMRVSAAAQAFPLDQQHSLELWGIGPAGTPVSIGVLPLDGRHEMALPEALAAAIERSLTLAVSLEPQGGSPTGAPTGPVLLTAPTVRAL